MRNAMKHAKLMLIAALFAAFCSAAGAQDVAGLITQIQSADEAQRAAAVDALASAGAPAIEPLFGLLEGENRDADVAARLAIGRIVYRASAPGAADRSAVAQALAQVAEKPGRPGVRRYALRMVSFVGRDDVVPTLARLLADPEVGEMARWALVRIPGDKALGALLKAVPTASGEFKAGIINALAARGTLPDAQDLVAALKDRDEEVRVAAIEALGRIPLASSERALREALSAGSARERAAAGDAYLRLAEALLAAGQKKQAAAMFQRRYRDARTEQERCAALRGMAKAGGERAVPVLLKALSGPRKARAGVAASALAAVPGPKATVSIVQALRRARGETRLRLIQILGHRRDRTALPALSDAADSRGDVSARVAAVRAMGEIGSPEAMPALVAAAGDPEERVSSAAVTALALLPGSLATNRIQAAAESSPAGLRATLVRVLGYRHDAAASPALTEAMKDSDPGVRLAAIQAAGDMGDGSLAPAVLAALSGGSSEEQAAAQESLGRMRSAEARQAMVSALDGAPEGARAVILRALGSRVQPDLFPVYLAAAKDPSDQVASAALDALGRLRDEKAAPAFVEAARGRSPAVAGVAARGYLLLGDAFLDGNGAQAVEMARLGLTLPGSADDRRVALRAIGHLRDAGSLPSVVPLLSDESLASEAASALVAIADGMAASDKEKAIELYRQALAHGKDAGLLRDAIRKLRGLGVEVDPAADAGFVTHWWVIGPFPGARRLVKQDPVATGGPIDVSATVDEAGTTYAWKPVQVEDPTGKLDLDQTVADRDDCGAYMYAEVSVGAAQDVLLKIGSDDDVVCWLNGKRVHEFWGGRGYSPDEDVVPAHLQAGSNSILMKVLDQGADWAGGLRITDPSGRIVSFQQRKP